MKSMFRSRVEGETKRSNCTSNKDSSIGLLKTDLFFPPSRYTPFFNNEGCLNIKRFISPEKLKHEMTDEEIFWRASMVPLRNEYPFKRVPKVAFMFLTCGLLPLAPLWDKFFNGHEELFSVYVHALSGYKLNVSKSLAFYGRLILSQDVQWGSYRLTDAQRRLLANALLDFSNERFVLLSESSIPVYDFPSVYKYLMGSTLSFVETYDDPSHFGRGTATACCLRSASSTGEKNPNGLSSTEAWLYISLVTTITTPFSENTANLLVIQTSTIFLLS